LLRRWGNDRILAAQVQSVGRPPRHAWFVGQSNIVLNGIERRPRGDEIARKATAGAAKKMVLQKKEELMRRILLLLCLVIVALPAWAAENIASPNADSAPLQRGVANQTGGNQPEALQLPANCPARPPPSEGAPSTILVGLDPDTLWRPRGSEVRFTIRSPGGTIGVSKVRVCFGWSSPGEELLKNQALIGSPQVRSVGNDTGAIEYGATVPFLVRVPNSDWWPSRAFASTPYVFTGAFTVPVADMVVEVTTTAGQVVVTVTQVGVTSAVVAWAVVVAVAVLVWMIMDSIARHRRLRGRNLLLRVISTEDGYASLSQLQIVLWTVVVGMSAIYVMTLSGNLISISDGTLILLGIASATALAARLPGSGPPTRAPLDPSAPPAEPQWSDLIIPDRSTGEIDVTRLQMLSFTLITAAFVLVKVVTDYEIPSIPANFLVLMGISNGVYVGGRSLPSQPKHGGVAP
jgi:hypothetical protein